MSNNERPEALSLRTQVVQQLSGRDPLAERLAHRYIDRVKYPSLRPDDDFEDAMRELVAGELRALEEQKPTTPETGATVKGTRLAAGTSGIVIVRLVGLDRGLVTSKTELLVPITTKPEFMSPLGPSRRARDVSDMSG
jgi:hypothetical protein